MADLGSRWQCANPYRNHATLSRGLNAIADRYNWKFLKPYLERAGFTEAELTKFVEFGQGFASMSPAIREFESLLLAKKLRHGAHPVLNMCAQNARLVSDSAGNRKFVKGRVTGRIDGIVALTMAVAMGVREPEKAPAMPKLFFM